MNLFHANQLNNVINGCLKILRTQRDLKFTAYDEIMPLVKNIPGNVADELFQKAQRHCVIMQKRNANLHSMIPFHKM